MFSLLLLLKFFSLNFVKLSLCLPSIFLHCLPNMFNRVSFNFVFTYFVFTMYVFYVNSQVVLKLYFEDLLEIRSRLIDLLDLTYLADSTKKTKWPNDAVMATHRFFLAFLFDIDAFLDAMEKFLVAIEDLPDAIKEPNRQRRYCLSCILFILDIYVNPSMESPIRRKKNCMKNWTTMVRSCSKNIV